MADINKQDKRPPGKLALALIWITSALGILFISIILSIIIEWLGIAFQWWQSPGYLHAKNMFDTELSWVLGDFLSVNTTYRNLFINWHDISYNYTIKKTGLEHLANTSTFFIQYIVASVYIIEVVFIRIMVIICAIPAFIIITLFATFDGMLKRKLRRATAATESSFLYHISKRWIKPLIALPIIILLSSPYSIHPSIFVLCVSIVPGISVWITATYFKKYL